MCNEEFISSKEIDEIEKVEVDDKLLEKLKQKQTKNFSRELIYVALQKVKDKLDKNEEIETYIIGKDYNSNIKRSLCAIVVPWVSHPLAGWFVSSVVIKTNKRVLLMQLDGYFKYATHYEISKEIHIFEKNELSYLKVRNIKDKLKIIECDSKKVEKFLENIKCQCTIMQDKNINCASITIYKIILKIETAAVILVLLYYIYYYFIIKSVIL